MDADHMRAISDGVRVSCDLIRANVDLDAVERAIMEEMAVTQ